MIEFLKSFENIDSATVNINEIDLEFIGKFGQSLSKPASTTDFLQKFRQRCQRALQVYAPSPDPRPTVMEFAPNSENTVGSPSFFHKSLYMLSTFRGSKELMYRIYNTEIKLVRSILENSGFKPTDSHMWNVLWVGKSAQEYLYEDLNPYQKINHFPNSFEITRKDKMCKNLQLMKSKFPKDYGFFPDTYIIPKDIGDFTLRFYSEDCQWIVKPCNSSQGKGIFILDSLASLNLDDGCIISRYIANPFLLNNLKCDLRIYVLITSFEPLKIYIYEEGLARFACESYNSENSSNKFVYLTNYSINKKSGKFIQNTDWHEDNIGHKWSFSAFIKEMDKLSLNTDEVIRNIYDLIIKTIISIEGLVVDSIRRLALVHNNCFDLLGFDIMLDQDLKPWLLEVNLSPSLNTDSPLDLHIKSHLIADVLNLVGIRAFDRKHETASKTKSRIKAKQNLNTKCLTVRKNGNEKKTDESKYKNLFLETIEESLRTGRFIRIYPFPGCRVYDKLFKTPRKVNNALYSFLFKEILKDNCVFPGISPNIDEDDIIDEYLIRVCRSYKSLGEKDNTVASERMDSLARYFGDNKDSSLKTILGYLNSKNQFNSKKNEKNGLLKNFTTGQLENMISLMEKNVVKLLFNDKKQGIFTEMMDTTETKPKVFRYLRVKSS